MRVAALGDAHLGRSAYSTATAEGVNQREADFEASFAAAVDAALAAEPDVFVWLGDIFDHPRPTYRSFRVAMQALTRIRAHGVPLVAISGNHDTPRLPGTGNPYAVLGDAFPEYNFVHRMEYQRIEVGGRGGLVVHAVPQTRTAEDAVEALREADRRRGTDATNLLLTHPLVTGIERRYADINEIEVDADELRADLVLLGHYHTFMKVRPGVWYAGSTDTFGFGDVPEQAKGIVLLDTDGGTCRHVALSGQRPLATPHPVSAWGLGVVELQSQIVERLSPLPGGSVARVVLDGVDPAVYRLLDLGAIQDAFRHLLHFRLEPVFVETTAPVFELPELASLAARWQAYVAEQPVDDLDRERLAETGLGYLERAIDASIDAAGD